jgi:hypothetical protein
MGIAGATRVEGSGERKADYEAAGRIASYKAGREFAFAYSGGSNANVDSYFPGLEQALASAERQMRESGAKEQAVTA